MIGPLLIAATLAAPLVLFAMLLAPGLRSAALALRWLAPVPALLAAALALTGRPIALDAPALRMSFLLDAPGAMLLLVSALLWMAAGASGWGTGFARDRDFGACWLLTMTGSFGVFVAADLLTFYLAYALVSIPAYGLIAAEADVRSRRAGGVYMAFAILGEAFLLAAFAALVAGEPQGSLRIADVVTALPASPWREAAVALVILGFGMKIALVPLNGWMPLTYAAAPFPAAAVLSGAGVKAGVIGLIRFLPLGAAMPGWRDALAVVGFVTAFYGALVGLTQTNPKTILAYSSISQMGLIAAALGLGFAAGHGAMGTDVAFYAANHVLVKGGLFLAIAALAATGGQGRRGVLVLAALMGLGLAGLPLTGGYLAKLAVKDAFGSGATYALATASSVATALLMTHFLFRLAAGPPSPEGRGAGGEGLPAGKLAPLLLWFPVALAAILAPWLLAPTAGLDGLLDPAKLWDALWPVAIGVALAVALTRANPGLPRIPEGDSVVLAQTAFLSALRAGPTLDSADALLRGWPAGSVSLAAAALILAAATVFLR